MPEISDNKDLGAYCTGERALIVKKMAEQPSEHQPLLKSNDEGESDPEQPSHVSHNEDLNSGNVAEPQSTEITPAILEEGTIFSFVSNFVYYFV